MLFGGISKVLKEKMWKRSGGRGRGKAEKPISSEAFLIGCDGSYVFWVVRPLINRNLPYPIGKGKGRGRGSALQKHLFYPTLL